MKKRSSFYKYVAGVLAAAVIMTGAAPVSAFGAAAAGNKNKTEENSEKRQSRKDRKGSNSDSDTKKKTEEKNELISLECVNQSMNMKEGDYVSAEGVCYSFKLDDESAEAYPELEKKINEINEEAYAKFSKDMKKASDASLQRHMDGWEYPFEEDARAEVTRADSKAFSYNVCYYSFLGGAHGYTYYGGTNIDPVTCRDIRFSDVVTDVSDFPQIVFDELTSQDPEMEEYFEGLSSDKDKFLKRIKRDAKSSDGPVWTLSCDGISLYFEDYAVGSYAAGSMKVDIPYKAHPEIFNKDYFTYDGKTPDINDRVTVKDIEEPVTIEGFKDIMQIGYEWEYEYSDGSPYCSGIVDKLIISDEYPELKKRVDKINSFNVKELRDGFGDFEEEVKSELDNASDGDTILHNVCSTGIYQYVTRADGAVFSTVESRETLSALEEYRTLLGINMDPETGEDIALDDVVTDISDLEDLIEDILNEEAYPETTVEDVTKELNKQLGSGKLISSEKLSFTVGYEGLTFYLNNTVNYSVMDFGRNAMIVFVPYSGNEDLFEEAYTDVPSSFAYQIPVSSVFSTSVYMDMNYNKEYSEVTLYPYADEYSTVTAFTFGINGSLDRVDDFYAYDITANLVKSPLGDYYIYLSCNLDDGFTNLRIFSFSFDEVYEDEETSGLFYAVNYSSGYEEEDMRGYIMTDPIDFHVLASDDVFSGRILYSRCCIDAFGSPKPRDGVWYYPEDEAYDLTATDDIKTDAVRIRKGDVMSPVGIIVPENDGYDPENGDEEKKARILLLKNSKGKEYSLWLEYNEDSWDWEFNEMPVKELFDGNYDILF
ncbi:MAG: DUF3298 and DUF4163 domain-containing protein [Lachnospiraceae bacterium]|nr:DUF3298 and DUF4163 domain-containing protein [Lachnospiraceae bacterium]